MDLRGRVEELTAANASLTMQMLSLRSQLHRGGGGGGGGTPNSPSPSQKDAHSQQLQKRLLEQEQELQWLREQHGKWLSQAAGVSPTSGRNNNNNNAVAPLASPRVLQAQHQQLQEIAELRRALAEKDGLLADTRAALNEARAVLSALSHTNLPAATQKQQSSPQQRTTNYNNNSSNGGTAAGNKGAMVATTTSASDEVLKVLRAPVDAVQEVVQAVSPRISRGFEDIVESMTPRGLMNAFRLTDDNEENVGIGVVLQSDMDRGFVFVRGVTPNGPAEAAGLQEGDIIRGVDGKRMTDDMNAVVQAVRGPAGSDVTVTIHRPKHAEPFSLRVTRGSSLEAALEAKKKRIAAAASQSSARGGGDDGKTTTKGDQPQQPQQQQQEQTQQARRKIRMYMGDEGEDEEMIDHSNIVSHMARTDIVPPSPRAIAAAKQQMQQNQQQQQANGVRVTTTTTSAAVSQPLQPQQQRHSTSSIIPSLQQQQQQPAILLGSRASEQPPSQHQQQQQPASTGVLRFVDGRVMPARSSASLSRADLASLDPARPGSISLSASYDPYHSFLPRQQQQESSSIFLNSSGRLSARNFYGGNNTNNSSDFLSQTWDSTGLTAGAGGGYARRPDWDSRGRATADLMDYAPYGSFSSHRGASVDPFRSGGAGGIIPPPPPPPSSLRSSSPSFQLPVEYDANYPVELSPRTRAFGSVLGPRTAPPAPLGLRTSGHSFGSQQARYSTSRW